MIHKPIKRNIKDLSCLSSHVYHANRMQEKPKIYLVDIWTCTQFTLSTHFLNVISSECFTHICLFILQRRTSSVWPFCARHFLAHKQILTQAIFAQRQRQRILLGLSFFATDSLSPTLWKGRINCFSNLFLWPIISLLFSCCVSCFKMELCGNSSKEEDVRSGCKTDPSSPGRRFWTGGLRLCLFLPMPWWWWCFPPSVLFALGTWKPT